jgi:hypothetical protein
MERSRRSRLESRPRWRGRRVASRGGVIVASRAMARLLEPAHAWSKRGGAGRHALASSLRPRWLPLPSAAGEDDALPSISLRRLRAEVALAPPRRAGLKSPTETPTRGPSTIQRAKRACSSGVATHPLRTRRRRSRARRSGYPLLAQRSESQPGARRHHPTRDSLRVNAALSPTPRRLLRWTSRSSKTGSSRGACFASDCSSPGRVP